MGTGHVLGELHAVALLQPAPEGTRGRQRCEGVQQRRGDEGVHVGSLADIVAHRQPLRRLLVREAGRDDACTVPAIPGVKRVLPVMSSCGIGSSRNICSITKAQRFKCPGQSMHLGECAFIGVPDIVLQSHHHNTLEAAHKTVINNMLTPHISLLEHSPRASLHARRHGSSRS